MKDPRLKMIAEAKGTRLAEKRRTSTCKFADRVAQLSIDYYYRYVPKSQRPPQTCIATIVAHFRGQLHLISMGVGTKFLSEESLRCEESSMQYGMRVRDCHAEVLARRAFRVRLTQEILMDLRKGTTSSNSEDSSLRHHFLRILARSAGRACERFQYKLREGVTLHFYSSSAPCGNATVSTRK